MLNLSMKPTGWFQIGWSAEIRPGQAVPMRYFGKDLVAFRSGSGVLSVTRWRAAGIIPNMTGSPKREASSGNHRASVTL